MIDLVFLHGFYSSPKSGKIQFLTKEIRDSDIGDHVGKIIAIDLYPNPIDFENMTVSSLLIRIDNHIKTLSNPIVLIGSSHGGLLARSYVDQHPNKIKGLILFAPALNFYDTAKSTHFDKWEKWKEQGFITVFHGAYQKEVNWTWEYIDDLKHFSNNQSILLTPTLLIHGQKDTIIPVEKSVEFVDKQLAQGTQMEAHYLPQGNHPLNNVFDQLKNLVINWLRTKMVTQLGD